MRVGNREDRIGDLPQLPLAFRHQRNDRRAPSLHFHQIAHGLFVQPVLRRQHDHRHVLVDERDRAMLHLSRCIAFGMNIGHFLQLQSPFQRDRKVDAAPEKQEISLLVIPLGNRHDLRLAAEHLLDQDREPHETVEPGLPLLNPQSAAHTP
ncbi:MAG: hypothetical protein JW394_0367 [Nitrospira sp.]|nr:hypothetical protein [Nitrospira sp.]